MPTAVSSTDGFVASTSRAVVDVGTLLRFRVGTLAHRGRARVAAGAFVVLTVAIAVVPAYTDGAGGPGQAFDLVLLLPSLLAGFVLLSLVSAGASGGGRELMAREPSSIYPISPTTDHLGALLLAPLNVAWLLQFWGLLGATSYAVGRTHVLAAQCVVVVWVLAATAASQVLAWSLEGVRRVPHGIVGVRLLTVAVLGTALGLQISDKMGALFDSLPTTEIVVSMESGFTLRWTLTVLGLLAALVVAVALGAVPAHIAAHRLPRDELKVESGYHAARPTSSSVLGALVRTDRGSVWRAVPMRRGVVVLALGPGIVAVLGDLDWSSMTILPGLVASGGALLYGVNAWCLDSRGALWRESLPVPPGSVFDARAYVLAEFLLFASLLTVLVAGLRAGIPDPPQVTALVCSLLVVTLQVVAGAMRWSQQRPFAVDLRSARATPAPPAMMVAYSTRLALSTTTTGLVFSGLAGASHWEASVVVALFFVLWSGTRLLRTRRRWLDPVERARVITTVAVA